MKEITVGSRFVVVLLDESHKTVNVDILLLQNIKKRKVMLPTLVLSLIVTIDILIYFLV